MDDEQIQRALAQAREEGRQQGREEGRQQGREEGRQEVLNAMMDVLSETWVRALEAAFMEHAVWSIQHHATLDAAGRFAGSPASTGPCQLRDLATGCPRIYAPPVALAAVGSQRARDASGRPRTATCDRRAWPLDYAVIVAERLLLWKSCSCGCL